METMKLIKGDCLIELKNIPTASVDLILVDPPYGMIKGMKLQGGNYSQENAGEWDIKLPTKEVMEECERVLKEKGRAIFFSQGIYTAEIRLGAHENLPFNYGAIWEKNNAASGLAAKKALTSWFEDISIFTKKYDREQVNPAREYSKKVYEFMGVKTKAEIKHTLGHSRAEHFFRFDSLQFGLPTEPTYNELIETWGIDKMEGFLTYLELQKLSRKKTPTFNLPEGAKSRNNIFKYAKEQTGHHPTQKPVELLRELINIFSDEGDMVLDFTMGSGSTGVACAALNRNFIGIELNQEYYDIAVKRIKEVETNGEVNKET